MAKYGGSTRPLRASLRNDINQWSDEEDEEKEVAIEKGSVNLLLLLLRLANHPAAAAADSFVIFKFKKRGELYLFSDFEK